MVNSNDVLNLAKKLEDSLELEQGGSTILQGMYSPINYGFSINDIEVSSEMRSDTGLILYSLDMAYDWRGKQLITPQLWLELADEMKSMLIARNVNDIKQDVEDAIDEVRESLDADDIIKLGFSQEVEYLIRYELDYEHGVLIAKYNAMQPTGKGTQLTEIKECKYSFYDKVSRLLRKRHIQPITIEEFNEIIDKKICHQTPLSQVLIDCGIDETISEGVYPRRVSIEV